MNTERRGINRRIHGNIKALVEQAKNKTYDFYDTKRLMKILSAEFDGYPKEKKKIKFKGKVLEIIEPASLANQSDAVALTLCMTIQTFADERNLYLIEYDENEIPFRSLAGRTQAQMVEYIAWLRQQGHEDEAKRLEKAPKNQTEDIR